MLVRMRMIDSNPILLLADNCNRGIKSDVPLACSDKYNLAALPLALVKDRSHYAHRILPRLCRARKMGSEMLSVTAPTYTDPSRYELSLLPRPTITEKTDVVIKVYAASINPVDVKKADGVFKLAVREK